MVLDLKDTQLRARVVPLGETHARLVLDYPLEGDYRAMVMAALAELLVRAAPRPKRRPRKPEAAAP